MLARAFAPTARLMARGAATSRAASTLVVAEHNNAALNAATLSAVTAAKAVGGDVHILVAGKGCAAVAEAAAAVDGVVKVLVADDEAYEHSIAENITALIEKIQGGSNYSHIIAASTAAGKNFIPRVAVKLDVAPLTDITAVYSEDSFERPMYAGNAVAKVTSKDKVKIFTVRTTAFEKAATEGGSASQESIESAGDAGKTKFVSEEMTKSDRPELTAARVVVAGGRALKSAENFHLIEELADKLKGAVGASRAAVDAEYAPNDWQIGQTGKIVAPELYIGAGISGAIQHLAGMKDSKVIVCINKDPEAPIFQVSDYGLAEDLFKAVPEMTKKL